MFYKSVSFRENAPSIFEPSLCVLKSLKLFDRAGYEKMLDSDHDGLLTILSDHQYDTRLPQTDEILRKAERELLKQIVSLSKNPLLKEYYFLPYDFFNLKLIYKGLLKREAFGNLKFGLTGTVSSVQLKKIYEGGVANLCLPLIQSISLFNREISEQTPFEVSALWDKYLLSYLAHQSKKIGYDFFIKLHSLEIDLSNLLTLFRLKTFDKGLKTFEKLFIPGGKLLLPSLQDLFKEEADIISDKLSYLDYGAALKQGVEGLKKYGHLTEMEKSFKKYYFQFLRKASFCFFGIEGIISYYWLKRNEISNLRLILTAKQNNIQKDWVLNNLRI